MLKHVGRLLKNKRRVIVAYHVVPGEPDSSIVVTTESLQADDHDSLMKLVESTTGQNALDLAEVMARTRLPDGTNMLTKFHTTGKMIKVKSSEVEMTPTTNSSILLDELNSLIAKQKGIQVADLAIKSGNPITPRKQVEDPIEQVNDNVLTDKQLADSYRAQAQSLITEAERLNKEANELDPIKTTRKKTVKNENKIKSVTTE